MLGPLDSPNLRMVRLYIHRTEGSESEYHVAVLHCNFNLVLTTADARAATRVRVDNTGCAVVTNEGAGDVAEARVLWDACTRNARLWDYLRGQWVAFYVMSLHFSGYNLYGRPGVTETSYYCN